MTSSEHVEKDLRRHAINVPVTMALLSLHPTSDDWAVEPRSLGTGLVAARTQMRDEGRHSAVQVMNIGEKDFVLCHGEFIGEAEQVITVENEEAASRPPDREEVFSEEATVPTGRPRCV